MSGLLGKIPKLTLKLPTSLAKAGKTMSECPLELSFALCEDNSWRKLKEEQVEVNAAVEKCETKSHACNKMENFNIFEKEEEEKSQKEDDNMEVTCSVSVDGQEKQEFSFTLYDLDTKEKVNKQDMEKIVVRSICEALGKTLKLPPSGSRTIKVKLAISPDSSKDIDTQEELSNEWKTPAPPQPEKPSPCKNQDYDSSKSANTVSTYLLSSTAENQPSASLQNRCECASPSIAANLATRETKHLMSPKFRAMRHNRLASSSSQKHELRSNQREHRKKLFEENIPENRAVHTDQTKASDEQLEFNHNSRDHVPESKERRNHYLDLAGVENDAYNINGSPHKMSGASYADPNFMCPYRILDRSHVCSKPPRTRNGPESPVKKSSLSNHPKINGGAVHTEVTQGIRTQNNSNVQDDFLNLNLDLCDLVPDAKFDWEKIPHRRSKSHDMHFSGLQTPGMVHSPKVKQKHGGQNLAAAAAAAAVMESQRNPCGGGSPVHNYRMRHRDKDRQRAMQQVANWIAREHAQEKVENETHFLSGGFVKSPESSDKHEHHHVHEHVHHHYHHFVDF